ncbi:MAG TPA: Os1348 family NHLP clan protein [Pyrinomonadaceae bacterium]|nr:Os1348 family NHLP clan protein [Pyrinomonadaceae bacterium]
MSRQAVEQLIDKWMDDADFRAEFRQNPETAIQNGSYELDKAEWQAIKAMDFSASDEELMSRANKGGNS